MKKCCIVSRRSAPVLGSYSHAVAAGNLLFVSGQIATKPDGSGLLQGSFEEEARLALENLKTVLEDAGSGLEHVVKTTVFLSDMQNWPKFNDIYKEYFTSDFPARSSVQVALFKGLRVEVEAVAVLPQR